MAPSCKLELARFSANLRVQDGAECGNIRGRDTEQIYWGGGDTAQIPKKNTNAIGRVVGGGRLTIRRIMPLRDSILQAGTCQILSLAENPRWSRVWQQEIKSSKQEMRLFLILLDLISKNSYTKWFQLLPTSLKLILKSGNGIISLSF